MIHVSIQPEIGVNKRAFAVSSELLGPGFTDMIMPELKNAYKRFFVDNTIDRASERAPCALVMRLTFDDGRSWFWQFVCSDKVDKSGTFAIIHRCIIDEKADKSTLERDMPLLCKRLEAPIDIDEETRRMMATVQKDDVALDDE